MLLLAMVDLFYFIRHFITCIHKRVMAASFVDNHNNQFSFQVLPFNPLQNELSSFFKASTWQSSILSFRDNLSLNRMRRSDRQKI